MKKKILGEAGSLFTSTLVRLYDGDKMRSNLKGIFFFNTKL